MQILKEKNREIFKIIKNQYYAENLSISSNYVCNILGGYKCTDIIAKGLISVRFNIAMNDEKMPKLLKEYFYEVEE